MIAPAFRTLKMGVVEAYLLPTLSSPKAIGVGVGTAAVVVILWIIKRRRASHSSPNPFQKDCSRKPELNTDKAHLDKIIKQGT